MIPWPVILYPIPYIILIVAYIIECEKEEE